jgi:hypothetical protein
MARWSRERRWDAMDSLLKDVSGKIQIPITGIWLRRIGDDAEVLVEVNGIWYKAITEHAWGNYSHIASPRGFKHWKMDSLS